MGMWKNYGKGGQINWQRGRGQVNYASGPKEDHTDGRGEFKIFFNDPALIV